MIDRRDRDGGSGDRERQYTEDYFIESNTRIC